MGQPGVARAIPAPIREPVPTQAPRPAGLAGETPLHQIVSLCVDPVSAAGLAPECWPVLLRVALEHGVAPLVHLRVREQPIPEIVRIELARIYRANLARNVVLNRQRAILEEQLRKHGVAVVALKGPQLSELLYGDVGARQIADLDLLIHAGDLPAADRVLTLLGYVRSTPDAIAGMQECRDVLYVRELGDGARVFVDLHMRLRPYGRRDALVDRVWREGMSRENLLLYLCLNLMTHRFARLQPYLDLVAFLQKEEARLDWNRVTESAREMEWTPGIFYCLTFAGQLEKMRTPPPVFDALRPSRLDRRMAETILGRDAHSALARSERLDGPCGTLAVWGCERGFARKLRLAGSILFPPGPALRQMDVPTRKLSPPWHYLERVVRKAMQLARNLAAPNRG